MTGQVSASAGAADALSSWTDGSSDVVETAQFLDGPGGRVLAFLYRPRSATTNVAVVLCGSIYEDFVVNYRPEVLVARELARRGFAVVRFNYRGFGNSDAPESGAVTFGSLVADADAATQWLRSQTGATDIVWIGSRVGALVASHLASRHPGSALVLWAPMLSGADFFKGMSRASLLIGVRAEARKRQSPATTGPRLGDGETIEMLGNQVLDASYQDLREQVLPEDVGARPVLLLQLGTSQELPVAMQRIVDRWRAAGAVVDVDQVRVRQLWSIPDKWEPVDAKPETRAVVDGLSSWVERTMGDRQ